jgi:hypothetical protein
MPANDIFENRTLFYLSGASLAAFTKEEEDEKRE